MSPYPSSTTFPGATTFPGIPSVVPPPPPPPPPPEEDFRLPTVLTNVFVEINGVSISSLASDVSLESTAAELDMTPLGNEVRVWDQGIRETRLTTTVFQDFASMVDQMLETLYSLGEPFALNVRPHNTAVAEDNPSWGADAILVGYDRPGEMGEAATIDLAFVCDGPLVRTTA